MTASLRDRFRRVGAAVCPTDDRSVSLALCSHDAGEGVSWMASRLACSLAEDGRSVLLVDANAAHPSQREIFGIGPDAGPPSPAAGFEILSTPWPRLSLAVPESRPDAAEDASRSPLVPAIEALGARTDVVLIDCEPFVGSAQVLQLRSVVDGVLLVLESERSRREVIGRMLDSLRRAQLPIVGVLLNKRKRYIPAFVYRLL